MKHLQTIYFCLFLVLSVFLCSLPEYDERELVRNLFFFIFLCSFPLGSLAFFVLLLLQVYFPSFQLPESTLKPLLVVIMVSVGFVQWFYLLPKIVLKIKSFEKIWFIFKDVILNKQIVVLTFGIMIGVGITGYIGKDPRIKYFVEAPEDVFSRGRLNGDSYEVDFAESHLTEMFLISDLVTGGEKPIVLVRKDGAVVLFQIEERLKDYWLRVKPLSADFDKSWNLIYEE